MSDMFSMFLGGFEGEGLDNAIMSLFTLLTNHEAASISFSNFYQHLTRSIHIISLRCQSCITTMAAFSRGIKSFPLRGEYICFRCLQFSTSSASRSGHNRWSKIKHDKGAVDAKKNVLRSSFSREITLASKCTFPPNASAK